MKILLIKLNHIGDTLILTPTIKSIRNRYPKSIIHVMVRKSCEGVLEKNSDIDKIFTIASPEKSNRTLYTSVKDFLLIIKNFFMAKYDYTFDLSNSDRARFVNLISFSNRKVINSWHTNISKSLKKHFYTDFVNYAWGKNHQVLKDYNTVSNIIELPEQIPSLQIDTGIKSSFYNQNNLENMPYIVIHATSRWSFKQWEIIKWKNVIKQINLLGYKTILTCGPNEIEIKYNKEILKNDILNISTFGSTSLRELAFIIKNAKLFIGVDTLASHISAAVQTPSVILFGPTDEWSWHPWKVEHKIILGNCTCKEKRKITCNKNKILPCMSSITEESVFAEINKLLVEQ